MAMRPNPDRDFTPARGRRRAWGLFLACLLGVSALLLTLLGAATGGATGLDAGDSAQQHEMTVRALSTIRQNRQRWNLTAADVDSLRVLDQVFSPHNGVTHLYLGQTFAGLDVFNAQMTINLDRRGNVLYTASRLIPDLASRTNNAQPSLSARQAVQFAAAALDINLSEPLIIHQAPGGPSQELLFSAPGISRQPIAAKLVYQPADGDTVRLAWNVEIDALHGEHYWSVRIDAASGELLDKSDLVRHDQWGDAMEPARAANTTASTAASGTSNPNLPAALAPTDHSGAYLVYALPRRGPHDGPRTLEVDPAHALASPFAWHDSDGLAGPEDTATLGNNVHAYTDIDADDLPDPGSEAPGGAGLVFSHTLDLAREPQTYRDAAVTNLFYWNNIIHDVFYLYGFDEASGNFQLNNYGRGGVGGDAVRAEAQDGRRTNNANFTTFPEGLPPRMQMYLWDETDPWRDGDLSSTIIVHEYGHGISTRLAGGPSNVFCLFNDEQMGEGWSDFFALALTGQDADSNVTPRSIGAYVLGQDGTGPGIRPTHYSTDLLANPTTYEDVAELAIPHGVGYAWATMLWDVYWALVTEHGFNPDIYGHWTEGGNNLALQLVVDGLKFQACRPGFVDGRDAILAADAALTGAANQCLLWEAFARRGLGFSADQGSPESRSDGVAAYDLPPVCKLITVQPASQEVCAGTPATYEVIVGEGFAPPVSLAVTGAPDGVWTAFSHNPVTTLPFTSTLSISNTAGLSETAYTLTLTATDSVSSHSLPVTLSITTLPSPATLSLPHDGATDMPSQPTFTWHDTTDAQSFLLQVDDDAAFGSIDYSAIVTTPSHQATTSLQPGATYHWRVTPQNSCGSPPPGDSRRFSVAEAPPPPDSFTHFLPAAFSP